MSFSQWLSENVHNPSEAPEGYVAVKKKDFDRPDNLTDNYCNHCDYRSECCGGGVLVSCMGYSRADGIGVVFKRK